MSVLCSLLEFLGTSQIRLDVLGNLGKRKMEGFTSKVRPCMLHRLGVCNFGALNELSGHRVELRDPANAGHEGECGHLSVCSIHRNVFGVHTEATG
jgi:hypothetical protein